MSSEPNGKTVSRRDLLKGALATGGAIAASTLLPEKWIKPLIRGGVLPAHAQTSLPTATPGATNTSVPPATDTPAPTSTATATNTPTSTPTNTPTPTPTPTQAPAFEISASTEDYFCADGIGIALTATVISPNGGSVNGINMKADVTYGFITSPGLLPAADVTLNATTDSSGLATFPNIAISNIPGSANSAQIHYYFADAISCTTNCTRDGTIAQMGC